MYSAACVIIVEEPASTLTAELLEGVNSTRENRTYPSIKIVNYTGKASVVVSCVTTDKPHKPHPHELMGPNCRNGVCYITSFSTDSREPSILSFPELKIQCSKKDEIAMRLYKRNPEMLNISKQSEQEDDMKRNLHSVRLCFHVFILPDAENPNLRFFFKTKVTQPITDKKTPIEELKIHNMSDTCSPVSGGKKIMIFCNKISKKDIRIRFFEEDAEKREIWVGWGKFQRHDVHRDVAIAFTTPEYGPKIINTSINIFIELVRPSDNARSERIRFQFNPDVTNIDVIMSRKRCKVDKSNELFKFLETKHPPFDFPGGSDQELQLQQQSKKLNTNHENREGNASYYPNGRSQPHEHLATFSQKQEQRIGQQSKEVQRNYESRVENAFHNTTQGCRPLVHPRIFPGNDFPKNELLNNLQRQQAQLTTNNAIRNGMHNVASHSQPQPVHSIDFSSERSGPNPLLSTSHFLI